MVPAKGTYIHCTIYQIQFCSILVKARITSVDVCLFTESDKMLHILIVDGQ